MENKERTTRITDRITETNFFTGIFAVVAMEGYETLFYNRAFETDVAKIFQEFTEYAKQNGFEMPFRIRLHPFHGDSQTIHNGILSAMQRDIISLDSPGNEVIRIKLTKDEATNILDKMTGGKLFTKFARRIIDILSHEQ